MATDRTKDSPAFPIVKKDAESDNIPGWRGMSKREWIATQMARALISKASPHTPITDSAVIARSVVLADALIAALSAV